MGCHPSEARPNNMAYGHHAIGCDIIQRLTGVIPSSYHLAIYTNSAYPATFRQDEGPEPAIDSVDIVSKTLQIGQILRGMCGMDRLLFHLGERIVAVPVLLGIAIGSARTNSSGYGGDNWNRTLYIWFDAAGIYKAGRTDSHIVAISEETFEMAHR